MARDVWRAIGAECVALGAEPVAIGGMADHVHLLVRLPATLALAELMKRVKGSSAHLINHSLLPGQSFRWQGGYGAFSVGPRHVEQVADYIARQGEHHALGTARPTWELSDRPLTAG